MNNQFLTQTIKFIEESDLRLISPSIRPITFGEGKSHTVHISAICRESENKINNNTLLSNMIVFTLFDVFIDIVYPNLEGLSFRSRYLNLPETTPTEKVFKEVYRIFKLVRNAMVHSRDSLDMSAEEIKISYMYNRTKFELFCCSSVLQLLSTIVLAFSKNIGVNDKYFEVFILSYYQELRNNIKSFHDDIDSSLEVVALDFVFKFNLRYRININKPSQTNNNEFVIPEYNLDENECWAGIDYVIEMNDAMYLIPSEKLDGHKTINSNIISEWEINKKNTFAT